MTENSMNEKNLESPARPGFTLCHLLYHLDMDRRGKEVFVHSPYLSLAPSKHKHFWPRAALWTFFFQRPKEERSKGKQQPRAEEAIAGLSSLAADHWVETAAGRY